MTNYFVDPAGSDTATGLSGAPWKTIAHAMAVVAAAGVPHVVEVASGTYGPFTRTGNVTLQAASGATVIVECASSYAALYATGSVQHAARFVGMTAGVIEGIRFRNAPNQWGSGLFLDTCTGTGSEGSRSIQVIDCEFDHNHSFGWQAKASSGIDVIRPVEYKNDTGHQVGAGCHDIWIDSPTSHDNDQMVVRSPFTTVSGGAAGSLAAATSVGQMTGIKVSSVGSLAVRDYVRIGSEVRRVTRVGTAGSGGTGIDVDYHLQAAWASGTPFVEVQTPGGDRGGNAAVFYYCHDIRESGGTYYNNRARSDQYGTDGGIDERYGCWNVTIEDYVGWDNENVVETGQGGSGDRSDGQVWRNGVVYDSDPSYPAPLWPMAAGRKPLGMIMRAADGGLVEHMTLYGFEFGISVQAGGAFAGSIDGLTIRDNILFGGGAGSRSMWVDAAVPGSVVIDYNDIYNPGGTLGHRVGTDNVHGVTTDPLFFDRAGRDFHLSDGSPAIAAGHDGSDMGALEADPVPPPPPPDPGDPPVDPDPPVFEPPAPEGPVPTGPDAPAPPAPPPVQVPIAVSAGFVAAVKQPHKRIARIQLLASDLSVVDEITGVDGVAVDGSVSIDANRRRTCQVTLANPGGAWTPSGPDDPLFVNRLIRIERGIEVDGLPELIPLGLFLIDRARITVDPSGSTVDIAGQDRVKLSAKSRFTLPETYPAGMSVAEIVQTIATEAGMGGSLFRLNDGGNVLGGDRTFETNSDRWPAITQLATDFALVAYVDRDGFLVLEPAVTLETVPEPAWTFERGREAIMLGITKEWSDDQLYNHVRVIGQAGDLPPVMAEDRDLNPASPAYNPIDGTGPIGDRLFEHTSPMIRSIEQAQEVASAKLLEVALVQEALTIPSVVHPALQVGDAIVVNEQLSATADTYLIDTLTIPLGAGAMTVSARKLRDLRAL